MKRRVCGAFAILCALALVADYSYDLSKEQARQQIAEIEITEDGMLTAGVLASTTVDIGLVEEIIEDSDTSVTGLSEDGTFCGYTNLGICIVGEGNLNVRQEPEEGTHIVGKLPKNAGCEILEETGEWTKIKSGKVEGYVKSEYLATGDQAYELGQQLATLIATSNTGGLNVRTQPNTDCTILAQMGDGEEIEALSTEGEWIKVDVDGEEGYVFGEYVKVELALTHAMTIEEVRFGTGVSQTRADLCTFALKYVGNPYVWGGISLTKGADCSGFVLSVYKNYGVSLPHSSRAQANCGKRVKYAQLKPGDLVFYGNGKSINHVAIYIGGGQIVHASNRRDGIKISNVFYRTPVCYAKILSD